MNYNQIPETLLVPGMYQEIDNSLAGKTSYSKKVLLVASYLASATAASGKVTRVTNAVKAAEMFGYGSPMSIMAESFLTQNKQADIELYALPITESGVAYEESFTVSLKNVESNVVKIKINDKEISLSYLKTDTAENIAAKTSVLINSVFNSPITAESEVIDNSGTSEIVLKIKSVCKGVENIKISFESENISFTFKR